MSELFPTLDTMKSNEAFYKTLKTISQDLNLELTNRIIIDFIFQGNCIIENMRNSIREYKESDFYDEAVLSLIKNSLLVQPEFSSLDFSDSELNILYNSLYINIPQAKI